MFVDSTILSILFILALFPIILVLFRIYAWFYNNFIYPRKKHNWETNPPGSVEAGPREPQPISTDAKSSLEVSSALWALLLFAFGIAGE